MEMLPPLFAVIDMNSGIDPMTYYLFLTSGSSENQDVINIESPNIYIEDSDNADDHTPAMKNASCIYHNVNDSPTVVNYWDTGMSLISSTENIPVYKFLEDDFTNSSSLIPIYASSTNYIIQSKRKQIIRKQMSQVIASPPRGGDNIISSYSPPPIVRTSSTSVGEATFSLPNHVANALVRTLILDKSECNITRTLFEEIPEIGITPCYHCNEYTSLNRWVSLKGTCPSCRFPVKTCMRYARVV